jgi:dTMP kinase
MTGMLADRADRRRLMLFTNLGRAALVGLLPFADSGREIAPLAGAMSVLSAMLRPAETAAVLSVVSGDRLVPALSLSQVTQSVARVAGPAAGAGLIGLAGVGPAFAVQSICCIAAALLILGVRLPPVAQQPATASWPRMVWREAWQGFAIVWTNRIVRGITAVEALWQVNVAALVVTTIVLLERSMGYGERTDSIYGLLTATRNGGAALGALVAGRVERRIGRMRLMAIGYLAPLLAMPAGLTPPLAVLFACWFSLGLADAWAVIGMQAYLAESVADSLRGRMYASLNAGIYLGAAGAFAAVGWLTAHVGPPATLIATGLVVGIGNPLVLLAAGAIAAMRDDDHRRK